MTISHQEQQSPREHWDGIRRYLSAVTKGIATSNGVRETAEHALLMPPPSGNLSRPLDGISAAHARTGHGNHTFPPRVVTRRSPLCHCVNLAIPADPEPA
jgi:hypothetical protein